MAGAPVLNYKYITNWPDTCSTLFAMCHPSISRIINLCSFFFLFSAECRRAEVEQEGSVDFGNAIQDFDLKFPCFSLNNSCWGFIV